MHLIAGRDSILLPWAAERLQVQSFGEAVSIGVADDDRLLAVVVYNHFHKDRRTGAPVDIEMSIVSESPRWCTRETLFRFFHYPFEQLGVVRVSATTSRKNKRARRLAERLGFKLEGTRRKAWDGQRDSCHYGLLREDCKWLRPVADMEIAA